MNELQTENIKLKNLRIVFMGTPEFAVASLDALLRANFDIVAVVTAPDKPAGRGMKTNESAVKKLAKEKGLKILQPEKLKNPEFLEELESLHADLQVVVAFRMLPEIVWKMPAMGTINLHASLLPQYRGAAPINWVIINGEKETGVTTFKLQQEIDTGNILLQERLQISENETAGEVHDRMKLIGSQLLVRTIKDLVNGELKEIPQSKIQPAEIKLAPKIFTDTCKIDWNKTVDEIHNLIRGLSPFPGAFTYFDGKLMKVFKSHKEYTQPAETAGQYKTDQKTFLQFAGKNGYIYFDEIQLEGKKKMLVSDFLRGYR